MTNDQDLNLEFLRKWYEEDYSNVKREPLQISQAFLSIRW